MLHAMGRSSCRLSNSIPDIITSRATLQGLVQGAAVVSAHFMSVEVKACLQKAVNLWAFHENSCHLRL